MHSDGEACAIFCESWEVVSNDWDGHICNSNAGRAFELLELLLLSCFTIEALIKVCALRSAYFRSKFNLLDCIVVVSGANNGP